MSGARPRPLSPGLLLLAMGAGAVALTLLLPLLLSDLGSPYHPDSRVRLAAWRGYSLGQVVAYGAYLVGCILLWARTPRPAMPDPGFAYGILGLALGGIAAVSGLGSALGGAFAETVHGYPAPRSMEARLVVLAAYVAFAGAVAFRLPRAQPPPAAAATATPVAWDDRPLAVALAIAGVLVAAATLFLGALLGLGLCYNGCFGGEQWKESLPLLMAIVPVGYAVGAARFLQGRRRRAAADPAWASRALTQRSATAVAGFLVALLLGVLAGVASCFALIGLFSS